MKKLILLLSFTTLALSSYAQENNQDEETRRIMKMYNQAGMAMKMNNIDDAISRYEEIIRLAPDFPDTYMMLGDAYAKKTGDVSAVEKAIKAYQQYLQLNPQAENADEVQAVIDQMEYLFGTLHKKEEARANLIGRWASNIDSDAPCLFILNIQEIAGKIKIDLEPSSMAYSANLVSKTAYAETTEDGGYFFYFTDDNTYLPSQASYNLNRGLMNYNIGTFGGQYSGILGIVGNGIIDAIQENDIAKNTRKIYELKLMPAGNKFEGVLHFVHKTASQTGEKVLADSIVVLDFEKMNKNFVNKYPVRFASGELWEYRDGKYIRKIDKKDAKTNVFKDCPEIYKQYRRGSKQFWTGFAFTEISGGAVIIGSVSWAIAGGYDYDKEIRNLQDYIERKKRDYPSLWSSGYFSNEIAQKEKYIEKEKNKMKNFVSIGKALTIAGVAGLGVSIPIMINGNKKGKKAINMYNELHKNKRKNALSELEFNLNVSGNSLGLVVNF
ncbi:MAG: tetratricopeptide repeat protein [Prevotellaceae bacterium]|jgi:tetratricopeptide (TPR) repeat protein|nr:tetratricopeptide repeat protein [Prevotellaceae bacterium]